MEEPRTRWRQLVRHMGANTSVFSGEELEVYEGCTCLSASEVVKLRDKFVALGGAVGLGTESPVKVTMASVLEQVELRNNPFGRLLCEIFSSEEPGTPSFGDLNFDEYVDIYNCMSPRASLDIKMQTAFRMYDFDGNGYLTDEDLQQVLITIATPPQKVEGVQPKPLLGDGEVKAIVERVMRQCDIDGNNRLSYAEFCKAVERIPEFAQKFRIYIQ